MDVLHLAAECAPLAKVGGLGDVLAALPAATAAHGIRASVLLPLYGAADGDVARAAGPLAPVADGVVRYGGWSLAYRIWRADVPDAGVPVYLFDEPTRFGAPGVYVSPDGEPLADDRFVVFQRGALDWLAGPDAPRFDLLHLHDHHTALVPVLLAHDPEAIALRGLPTVLTVHSADHQGVAPWRVWEALGVHVARASGLMVEDDLNALKAGVTWATAVTVPSAGYADELTTRPEVSRGLVETFRAARPRLTGIAHGVDTERWTPATDSLLPAAFSADDRSGKSAAKAAIAAELGLDARRPLLVYIGRLMPEKGVELLAEGVERTLRHTEAAVAVLGAGDPDHETTMRGLQGMLSREDYGDRLAVVIGFDETLAHRLYAAADVFLVPSRTEPGGLAPLYALRYGAPPVVHAVGGLRDRVVPWDGEAGTGFWFESFTAAAFAEAIGTALEVHARPDDWDRVVRAGMATDVSWDRPAAAFADLYARVAQAVVTA